MRKRTILALASLFALSSCGKTKTTIYCYRNDRPELVCPGCERWVDGINLDGAKSVQMENASAENSYAFHYHYIVMR